MCAKGPATVRYGDLKTQSLDDFIASAPPSAPWFFVHIPKTAGSSFSNELRAILQPYKNVHIDYTNRSRTHDQQLNDCVDRFIASPDLARVRSASGHIPLPLATRIQTARPDMQLMTILRAPVARVVSDYRYQRTEMHPPHREFIAQFPTLLSYIEHPASHNKMARFIAGPQADRATVLRTADEKFAFIGLLEMYAFSFATFFALTGNPGLLPREHLRRTPATPETEVDVTPEIIARIREVNPLDVALYSHVHAILLPHRDAWLQRRQGGAKAATQGGGDKAAS